MDNFIVKALKYANKNPWMWAVYVFAIGIPLMLFIAFCCLSPVKKSSDKDSYDPAYTKKTDVPSPDDILEVICIIQKKITITKDLCFFQNETAPKESPIAIINEAEENEDDDGDEAENDETEEEDEEEEEEEEPVQPEPRSSPRQRRPRKE